jgi:hypothetical protein
MEPSPSETQDVFVLACDTLCQGVVPVGTIHEDGQPQKWLTFETEREAQLEIIDDIEEHIRQFRDGEREFEEIAFNDTFVMPATLHPDGSITTEHATYPPPTNDSPDPE